jgi:hypothetical protein
MTDVSSDNLKRGRKVRNNLTYLAWHLLNDNPFNLRVLMPNIVKDRWHMIDVSFSNFKHSPTIVNEKLTSGLTKVDGSR